MKDFLERMKRMVSREKRKAVSPIVATLLLILIAVAAAVVLYSWVSGLSSSTKSTGAEKTGVAFTVEAGKLYSNTSGKDLARGYNGTAINGSAVDIWVRNIGSVPIDNGTWSLYVLDPTTGQVVAQNVSWTFDTTLGPGDLVNMTVILSYNTTVVTAGDYYTVKVISPQGVADSIYVKAE
jgi:flagellin-like protein